VGDDRFWQALGSGTGSAVVRRRVRVGGDSGQVSYPSRSWWSADRPWWRPRGNAALVFEVIRLAKYLVTGEHYVVVTGRTEPGRAPVEPAAIVVRQEGMNREIRKKQGMNREIRPLSSGESGNPWVRVVPSAAMALVVLLAASLLLTACGDDGVAPVARPSAALRAELCKSVPRLDRLIVARSDAFPQNHMRFSFAAKITVADRGHVLEAARALCALPKMPSGTLHCPADLGIVYHLFFSVAGKGFPGVSVGATGCQEVHGLTTTRWVARTPGFWRTLADAMGLVEPSYATFRGAGPNGRSDMAPTSSTKLIRCWRYRCSASGCDRRSMCIGA